MSNIGDQIISSGKSFNNQHMNEMADHTEQKFSIQPVLLENFNNLIIPYTMKNLQSIYPKLKFPISQFELNN